MLLNQLRKAVAWSVLGLSLALTATAAADSWLAATPAGLRLDATDAGATPPVVTVPHADDGGLTVRLDVAGVRLRSLETKGGTFLAVDWPESAWAGGIGTPELPVVRRLFIAPPGAAVRVTADAGPAEVFALADAGLVQAVRPVQAPVEKLPGAWAQAPFDFAAEAYAVDADLPGARARVEQVGMVRGQPIFLLEMSPIAYNPVLGTLKLYPHLEVHVTFLGGEDWPRERAPLPGFSRRVLNPAPLALAPRASGTLLVIVAAEFEAAMAPFTAFKQMQGYDVLTWVPSSSSAATIKAYVQDLWDGGLTLDYVLLVGDTNTIGHFTGGGDGAPHTDLPYACMDGGSDWFPDLGVGRFPVRNATQLNNVLAKTLYYEQGPLSDPDYVMRAVFMASQDNWPVSEGTHNWVIDNYMIPNEIESDKLYCHTYGATTQQVRDAFNDGRFYGIYSGHGGTYSWADGPPFSQSDVNNLTNADMYPFVCSFACVTGTYTVDECFCETWIRAADGGAIAIYGSSVNSYWTEDDVLEKRLFDAIYDEDDEVVGEVAPVWNDARMRYLEQMGSGGTTRRYFEMYNLLGDPTLRFPNAGDPLYISFPAGLPEYLTPNTPTILSVRIESGLELVVPESATLYYRFAEGPFATASLTPLGDALYEAVLPAAGCGDAPEYYFSATSDQGTVVYSPAESLGEYYTAEVGVVTVVLADDFEFDLGWSVESAALETGAWERGVPADDGSSGDPTQDGDGSGQCFVTDNRLGNFDVDGGPTRLVSPALDLGWASDAQLTYARWFRNDDQDEDRLTVEVSNDNGATWVLIEDVADTEGWVWQTVHLADFVVLSDGMKLRFSAADNPNNSITEAAVDGVRIIDVTCAAAVAGDMNCDGSLDFRDINPFVLALNDADAWQAAHPGCDLMNGDVNGDGEFGFADINPFVLLLSGGGWLH